MHVRLVMEIYNSHALRRMLWLGMTRCVAIGFLSFLWVGFFFWLSPWDVWRSEDNQIVIVFLLLFSRKLSPHSLTHCHSRSLVFFLDSVRRIHASVTLTVTWVLDTLRAC